MDPITMITTAGAVKATGTMASGVVKSGLPTRLFGPLVDEIGASWADGYRRRNVEKVAEKAARRAKLETPNVVHARVAYRVLQDGSFCNDDTMQEYLAGLVAGSYSEDGGDDRASYYVDLVARMPAAQVRLHHAIYAALATAGPSEHYGDQAFLTANTVLAPLEAGAVVLEHPDDVSSGNALGEALTGLDREGLISGFAVREGHRFYRGEADGVAWQMTAIPTALGCMLALWAHGIRDADVSRLPETAHCNFDPLGPTFQKWAFEHGDLQAADLG